jgi:methylmalonyl-CoA mutase cobalamin-binding subunit
MAGPLKNARHERFAQEIAKGLSLEDAYASAGFSPSRSNAHRLRTNENVAARVIELQTDIAVVSKIDAAWVLTQAVDLHKKAKEAGAYAPAARALELVGKHVEVQAFKERIEHGGLIEYRNLSDDEISARIAAHEATRASRPTAH